jgi:hypothetical protein
LISGFSEKTLNSLFSWRYFHFFAIANNCGKENWLSLEAGIAAYTGMISCPLFPTRLQSKIGGLYDFLIEDISNVRTAFRGIGAVGSGLKVTQLSP